MRNKLTALSMAAAFALTFASADSALAECGGNQCDDNDNDLFGSNFDVFVGAGGTQYGEFFAGAEAFGPNRWTQSSGDTDGQTNVSAMFSGASGDCEIDCGDIQWSIEGSGWNRTNSAAEGTASGPNSSAVLGGAGGSSVVELMGYGGVQFGSSGGN